SNCDEVELFVNDRSHGRKPMVGNSHLAWQVRYEPGTLGAIGHRAGRKIARDVVQTSGAARQIVLTADRQTMRADGADVAAIAVSVVDAQGRPVPTAEHLIRFQVTGPGRMLGVGNGDPSSHESDKVPRRKLFNGLAMVLIQSIEKPGVIRLIANAEGLRASRINLHCSA